MSDVTLLMFGSAITFIAAAGAYVYMRGAFESQEIRRRDPQLTPIDRPRDAPFRSARDRRSRTHRVA